MKEKDKVSYLFEEAVNFFNQGDYSSAVAAWEEILKYDPDNTQARHGIRVATERMGAAAAPPPAAPAEPAAPAQPPAAGQPPQVPPKPAAGAPPPGPEPSGTGQAAAGGAHGDLTFDVGSDLGEDDVFGDDFGDPFDFGQPTEAEQPAAPAAPAGAVPPEQPPGEPAPADTIPPAAPVAQAPAPQPPSDDLGEPVPTSDLSAWGLPGAGPDQPVDEAATVVTPPAETAPPAAGPPPGDDLGAVDDLEDLGEPLFSDEALPGEGPPPPPGAGPPTGEPDEFGWGETPAEEIRDVDALDAVDQLEDLDLSPQIPEDEAGFPEKPEAEAIGPRPGSGILDLEGGGDEIGGIPLGAPPVPEGDDDIEDLEPDLELEPERQDTIPLARPIPRPAVYPTAAPARSLPLVPILGLVAAVVIVVGGSWFAYTAIFGGGGDNGENGKNGPTGPTNDQPPPPSSVLACDESDLAWRRGILDEALEKARVCLKAAEDGSSVPPETLAKIGNIIAIGEVIADRPSAYKRLYMEAVPKEFCVRKNWNEAFRKIQNLQQQFPQWAGEMDPYMAQIYFNLGVEQLQAQEPKDAIFVLEECLNRNPADAGARELLQFAQRYRNKFIDRRYRDFVRGLGQRSEGCVD